jgi:hypothetical protein
VAYPYTFLDLQREVKDRLRLDADPDSASGNDLTKIKDTINSVYADVCITNEVLQSKAVTASPTAGPEYTLTSTVLRVKVVQITTGGVKYRPLEWRSLDDILRYRSATTASAVTGPAQYYTLTGMQTLEVYPDFLGTETLEIWAVTAPTALSATSDVPVLPEPYASKCLVYGACSELADFTKDLLTGADGYDQRYQQWMMKLKVHLNRRKGDRANRYFDIPRLGFVPHDPSVDVGSIR